MIGSLARPRVLVLRAPGVNCDQETSYAFELAGADVQSLHVNRLLERPEVLDGCQILCLPGGFSYGDDISAGRILGSLLKRHLFEAATKFRDSGKLVLGICNGFQILLKSGLLLAASASGEQATLTWNASGRFEDRWVTLRVASDKSPFFAGITSMYLPIAHAEGKFAVRSADTLEQLEASGQLVLRYARADGQSGDVAYPENPNGALAHVAGICDTTGRICGIMPHPERHIDRTHHPRWTRTQCDKPGDGLAIFQNAVRYFA